jgi:long-chain acyl-CoA synthetase
MGGDIDVSATSAPRVTGQADTLPKLLLRNAREYAERPAIREKAYGIWQTWTWAQVLDEIRALSIGLSRLGLKRGETVAIIGDNRPRLYWTFAAAQALGAVPVPVYQDSVADEMAFVLAHAEVAMAVVENQEQVDKVLAVAARVPTLRRVAYDDDRGLKKYLDERLLSFEAVQEIGRKELAADPSAADKWLAGIAAGNGGDVAVMLYTSGTTGQPKGVVLTHENVVRSAENGNAFDKLGCTDEMLAYLPMAWVGDHIFSYGQSYAGGLCVACPESPATVTDDRREIGPTYFFAPPRVFETMLTAITVRMEDASRLKRAMFDYFLKVARRAGSRILDGSPIGLKDRLLYAIGNLLVYAPLRNRMGFSKLRVAYTAGEAIGPELFQFFRALGVNLKQLYGQTEASVYITLQPDGEIYPETVGKPGPEVEIRIADSGEVLFKSPGVFREYYKNEKATTSAKTTDGWVHTGDAGFIDERGHLHIIDRAKDVGRLTNGSLFSPKYIENKLKFYPNIKEAVTFGDKRDYVTAMINIDLTAVGNWAERNNISYASYQELAGHPQVYEMIRASVDEVNRSLALEPNMGGAQIKRFLILHKELDADDGELTRTLKVRRSFIGDRYAPLVGALYDGSKDCHAKTEITYEDGRRSVLEGRVRIVDMALHPVPGALKEAA